MKNAYISNTRLKNVSTRILCGGCQGMERGREPGRSRRMITMPAGSEEPELVRGREADEQMRMATETRERREPQLRLSGYE
jgi:hypothetical protein